jgi:hypothetical protein
VHNEPAVTAASGTMPDKKAPRSTKTIKALAALFILNRLD